MLFKKLSKFALFYIRIMVNVLAKHTHLDSNNINVISIVIANL